MKIKVQNVFNVEYSSKHINKGEFLVEADNIIEAIDIVNAYKKDVENIQILGIHTFRSILKPISKTVSHTINVEL